MRTTAMGLPLAVALAASGASGPATAAVAGWYVDYSKQLIAFLDEGQQGQAQAQCDDRKQDAYTAPVRTTLEAASDWLVKSHGFPSPKAATIPIQGDQYFVAAVYLGDQEDFCKDRVGLAFARWVTNRVADAPL